MATTREIVTLQFGHYSNFVGTHWWNMQENTFNYNPSVKTAREINYDIFYREGMTLLGEQTYTPRLVLFDLKSNLKTLKAGGELYDIPTQSDYCNWDGAVSRFETEPERKNDFLTDLEETDESEKQDDIHKGSEENMDLDGEDLSPEKIYDLDEEVTVWSDFLKVHLHPKTVLTPEQCLFNGQDRSPMDVFGYGREVYKTPDFFDDLENRMHFFVEECDRLQGFQILVDMDTGYGGLSGNVLEDLADEYGSKTLLTMGMIPGRSSPDHDHVKCGERLLNIAMSLDKLTTHSNLFVPLSLDTDPWYKKGENADFPHLTYKGDLSYHTSAIIASAIDTSTLHYRLDTPTNRNMSDLTEMLGQAGQTVAALSLGMPLTYQDKSLPALLQDCVNLHSKHYVTSLSPVGKDMGNYFTQSVISRGITDTSITVPKSQNLTVDNQVERLTSFKSVQEIFLPYLQSAYPRTYSTCVAVNQPCLVKAPYPHIFSSDVRSDGTVVREFVRDSSSSVAQTSVVTMLQSCSGIGGMLQTLVAWVKRLNIRKFHSYLESGMEMEEYSQMIENIQTLAQKYENKTA